MPTPENSTRRAIINVLALTVSVVAGLILFFLLMDSTASLL